MTYFAYKNSAPSTLAAGTIQFQIKEQLKARGWTVASSSDGTTYNASGDQITAGGSGAGGFSNNGAWFRIQCPTMGGVVRELCWQNNGSGSSRIKYSYSAGFTGGTPGAVRTPSATDEQLIIGGGTDAAPTYKNWQAATTTYFIVTSDVTEGYSFYCYQFSGSVASGTSDTALFGMDRIDPATVSVGDVDGYVFFHQNTSLSEGSFVAGTASHSSWFKKGLGGEGWVETNMARYLVGTGQEFTKNIGTDETHVGYHSSLPVLWQRRAALTAPNGYKGYSSLFRLLGTNQTACEIVDYGNGSKNKITVGNCFLMPWDGSASFAWKG